MLDAPSKSAPVFPPSTHRKFTRTRTVARAGHAFFPAATVEPFATLAAAAAV